MPARIASLGRRGAKRRPPSSISPAASGRRPKIASSVSDRPAPDEPRKAEDRAAMERERNVAHRRRRAQMAQLEHGLALLGDVRRPGLVRARCPGRPSAG